MIRSKSIAFALALALAACGGKDKGGTTTPTPPGDPGTPGEPGGMAGGDPLDPGGGLGGGTDPFDPGVGGGGDPGGGDPAGGDPGGEPAAPQITPPNLDPDPKAARAQVQQQLEVGRAALRATPPDGDGALRAAKLALAVDATSVDAAVMVAHAYYAKKLFDTAETILDELLKREVAKQNAGLYYVYGLVYDQQGKAPEAMLAYQTAVGLDGNHASALTNLGVHQLRNKQYAKAITTYERLTKSLNVSTAAVFTGLGSAYRGRTADYPPGSGERNNLLRQAETAYKQATTVDRNYGPAYYDLGLLYLDADQFPGEGGPSGTMDALVRLQRAKTYFDEYKNMPGADQTLYEARNKDVSKLIKREEKARKAKASEG
ncbi:MAG: tetratricopeptide repeat protein [Kofleriaceae bacterium]